MQIYCFVFSSLKKEIMHVEYIFHVGFFFNYIYLFTVAALFLRKSVITLEAKIFHVSADLLMVNKICCIPVIS